MPTCVLREGILTSLKVNSLSWDAEFFYRRLMSVVDAHGREFAHPAILRTKCFTLRLEEATESEIEKWLSECVKAGLVTIYGGGKYLYFHNYRQQARTPSEFPDPPGTEKQSLSRCLADAKQEGKIAELPTKLDTARMRKTWEEWQQHRRSLKKPLSWTNLFNSQIEFLSQYDEPTAYNVINYSLRNGYTGLFEPRQGANRGTGQQSPDRNKGTTNDGKSSQYRGMGKLVKP